MTGRAVDIGRFLAAHGWDTAERRPLPADASFRRYERLCRTSGETAMLMDAPPPAENMKPYLDIAGRLRRAGLSAPQIFAADCRLGLAVIEDFGDATFTRLLSRGADERALYGLAVDALAHLHCAAPPVAGLPVYDRTRLIAEARLFIDWYWPAALGAAPGTPPDTAAAERFVSVVSDALAPIERAPPTLVLRDFHVDNLMQLSGRKGARGCGLLDFQDAVAGPAAYDLMSLIEDARRDIAPDLYDWCLLRYRAAGPTPVDAGDAVWAGLAATRHAKVLGIFTRLWLRDGKPQYLCHLPRVWRLLERALAHPDLAPVAEWFAIHVPADLRAGAERMRHAG